MSYTYKQVIDAAMSADITGDPIDCGGSIVTYTFSWPETDSPIGTIDFEVCNNRDYRDRDSEIWVPLGVAVTDQPAGTADTIAVTLKDVGFQAIRPKYTRTSGGTGATMRAFVNVRKA
jgi:hypothetical protein